MLTGLILSSIFGLIVGSFLNVCIYRFPKNQSIVFPASHCPSCNTPIKFYDNIPLLSYIILRGKCRACGKQISLRYPAVEFITGLLTAVFYYQWHWNLPWLVISLLAVYTLIVVSAIDFETMMISDLFSVILVTLGLAGSPFNPCFDGLTWYANLGQSALGLAAGGGSIWLLAVLGKAIYKRDAVGEGDIFLMGAIGSLCGWEGVITTVTMASFFGSVYGISLMVLKKADRLSSMPFGPFLAIGAAINLYNLIEPSWFATLFAI